jgi:hypothetical protein
MAAIFMGELHSQGFAKSNSEVLPTGTEPPAADAKG